MKFLNKLRFGFFFYLVLIIYGIFKLFKIQKKIKIKIKVCNWKICIKITQKIKFLKILILNLNKEKLVVYLDIMVLENQLWLISLQKL